MQIIDLSPKQTDLVPQVAALLVEAFRENWPNAWPTLDEALEEVRECCQEGWISRVALSEEGGVLGWIGGRPEYDGNVWELHPLVVSSDAQGQGIGRALVQDFEREVQKRGALTIMLGSDDENNMTSLGGVDLYPDIGSHVKRIRNLRGHPYEFYQKLGFVIVGVIPDANGWGKPDILMAKRVGA